MVVMHQVRVPWIHRGMPAPAKSDARDSATQEQAQQSGPGRPRVPDSAIRALLANQMLDRGEQIPVKWLQDWVGVTEEQRAAQ